MTVTSLPAVHTLWHNCLYPSPRVGNPVTKDLSITDSAVSPIPGPECIWFFDRTSSPALFSSEKLIKSLEKTLASYPFFAGKLEEIPFKADGDWTERQGRLRVVYGRHDDPGVQVAVATIDQKLAAVIPSSNQRGRIWDSGGVPFGLFAGSEIHMALHDGVELGEASLMRVKITTFACGGVSIAAKIVHPIADAQNLSSFIQSWSSVHDTLNQSNINGWCGKKRSAPLLEPGLFMATAAGDLKSRVSDLSSLTTARALPIHRYDWWASSEGCPPPLLWRTQIHPAVKASLVELPHLGQPIPWIDLDITEPISHYNILFSPQEIERMHEAASSPGSSSPKQEFRVSHLDALLSHIWTLIIRARGLPDEDDIFFNMVVNFRSRVHPALPTTYIGTPAILAFAKSTTQEAIGDGSMHKLSTAIRSTIASLNPSTIPHFLHDSAHQIEPKRYWQTFIGKHHVTASSWLNHGIHDIDFGSGVGPRYVEPVMPPYLVCIIEPENSTIMRNRQSNSDANPDTPRPWYTKGAIVSLHFETRVMDRLLQDPQLRSFDY